VPERFDQLGTAELVVAERTIGVLVLIRPVHVVDLREELADPAEPAEQEATSVIDSAATRTRAIERRLRNVEELPAAETKPFLAEPEVSLARPELPED